jgi:16S rRNA (cytidine1402-2'-O)-methyltransferase
MISALYLVSTPIGNLDDITYRAISVLKDVDLIACEDTRNTSRLLSHFGIKKKLMSFHQHNEKIKTKYLLTEISNGKAVAYVSDAGTPAISDPGAFLVNKALSLKIKVSPIPGVSSVVTAFSVSGIESTRFQFYGFLPNGGSKARKILNQISRQDMPAIIFESPHRVLKTLEVIGSIYGLNYEIVIARELTKMFETIYKETVQYMIENFQKFPDQQKGEFVIVLTPQSLEAENIETLSINEALIIMMKELPLNQSVKLISTIFKKNKKEVYNQALELKNE